MAIRAIGNVLRVNGLALFTSNLRHRDNAFHRTDVSQLWGTENNVTDGVNTRFSSLHPAVSINERTVRFDLGGLETNIFRTRLATHSNQNFLSLNLLLLAIHADGA